MTLPNPFPKTDDIYQTRNPAFVLFGSRFFADQTVVELLAELLSVVFSDKWIGSKGPITSPLPSLQDLNDWASGKGKKLIYRPPIRLNLKLFALLCASPLSSRHQVHEEHYEYLANKFLSKVRADRKKPEEVKEWVEDFLTGFQGAGFDRTWCAQTFYPVTTNFLLQETIWNHTEARRRPLSTWVDAVYKFNTHYTVSRHRFLARGGELLYLQLCNLFSGKPAASLAKKLGYYEPDYELDSLHECLEKGFQLLQRKQFAVLDKTVDFIENLDPETHLETNRHDGLTCGWCPEESWPEAYLFAIEMSRILRATIDPVEQLELMQFGCALQVLRSMCAQSVRYGSLSPKSDHHGSVLGYGWVFSPIEGYSTQQRLASCQNLGVIFRVIKSALQNEDIVKHVESVKHGIRLSPNKLDTNYGHKYFNRLGKRLGIIYPWKGAEPRFVLTDKLLRYLVLSVLEPGMSCTYEEFKNRIYAHHGIAIEGQELQNAIVWTGLPLNSSVQPDGDSCLTQMLRAGGFLIELSDGCSIVRNPFSAQF